MQKGDSVIFTNTNEQVEYFKPYAFEPAIVEAVHPYVYEDYQLITIKFRDHDVRITVNKIDLYEI